MSRRIVVALAVLAALAVAVLLLQRREEQDRREERIEARLLQFDERAVTGFVLSTRGSDWTFERDGGGWRLRSPVSDVADVAMVERLLVATRRTRVKRVVEDPDALADYGLDPPVASVLLDGVETPRLDLGDADPTREGMFAKIEGRRGVLVLDLPQGVDLLHPDPNRLRLGTITDIQRKDVRALEIVDDSGELALERDSAGWWITRPYRMPASDARVDQLLGALESVTVVTFGDDVDRSEPRFGLGPGSVQVVLHGSDEPRALRLGALYENDLRFATAEGRDCVLAVEAGPLASVRADPRAVAETRLTKINRYAVVRFVYRSGGDELAAAKREGAAWAGKDGSAIEEDVVYGLLARLLEARITDWTRGSTPEGRPSASLEVELEGGATDRIDYFSAGTARVESLPGVVYRTASAPPTVPRS